MTGKLPSTCQRVWPGTALASGQRLLPVTGPAHEPQGWHQPAALCGQQALCGSTKHSITHQGS